MVFFNEAVFRVESFVGEFVDYFVRDSIAPGEGARLDEFVAVFREPRFRREFPALFRSTRFAQAQREIGLAAGEPPTTKGYCPSVFSLMPRLIERLGCAESGSITGILTVLVENDDLTDPVADSARSLLDGHIVLSRRLAGRGHFPAVDILGSVSRLMPVVTSPEHRAAAQKLREIYSIYNDAEDLINIGAFSPGSNRRIDGAIALIDRINNFLIQAVRERTDYDETIRQLTAITKSWGELLGLDVRAAGN